jgi:dGTPase
MTGKTPRSVSKGEEFTKALEQREVAELRPYALRSEERRNSLKEQFREYQPSHLEYRTEYQRDRDRIVWSKSFKRLQHKTQIFPYYAEDHYRRRLTHSLEVAQIATTIARALKLNEDATEAMALGHDLGHTPFGHAGESALNDILKDKGKKYSNNIVTPICGFNHCLHGIEVVSRIDQEYESESDHPGLNLTFDTRDGILKHMHDRHSVDRKRPFSCISKVVKFKSYKDFRNNKGSLEAQCVYFADKLAYLLSDIEDGIRCNVLQCTDLVKDVKEDFVNHIWEQYNEIRKEHEKLKLNNVDDFLSFRRKAITVLILNCIDTSEKILDRKNFGSIDSVLSCQERIIHVDDRMETLWNKFYEKWIRNTFFNDKRVVSCNYKAEKILTDLFNAYLKKKELIPEDYRKAMSKAYRNYIGTDEDLLHLITVRNYIAGMTDPFAMNQHACLFTALERVQI